jgi:hypothetical protein
MDSWTAVCAMMRERQKDRLRETTVHGPWRARRADRRPAAERFPVSLFRPAAPSGCRGGQMDPPSGSA